MRKSQLTRSRARRVVKANIRRMADTCCEVSTESTGRYSSKSFHIQSQIVYWLSLSFIQRSLDLSDMQMSEATHG